MQVPNNIVKSSQVVDDLKLKAGDDMLLYVKDSTIVARNHTFVYKARLLFVYKAQKGHNGWNRY